MGLCTTKIQTQSSSKAVVTSFEATIDFQIFDNKIEKCDTLDTCHELNRILNALKYYQLITKDSNDHKQIGMKTFTEFILQQYNYYLDDIIHLICVHSKELQEINEIIIPQFHFQECNILHCALTRRHYYGRQEVKQQLKNNITPDDSESTFIAETFDQVHYYIFHLFQAGLRSLKKNKNNENDEKDEKYDDLGDYFDSEFNKIHKILNEKKKMVINNYQSNGWNRIDTKDHGLYLQ
eukprot:537974_1